MSQPGSGQEWYYVGHYGRLGPLTFDQIQGLIRDQVIERTTYVWASGMADWIPAGSVVSLASFFPTNPTPPPFTNAPPAAPAAAPFAHHFQPNANVLLGGSPTVSQAQAAHYPRDLQQFPVSDRNRVVAGVLNLVFPGVGRLYLGHIAIGICQLVLAPCLAGYIWSVVDGILMLTGSVQFDGFGRRLN